MRTALTLLLVSIAAMLLASCAAHAETSHAVQSFDQALVRDVTATALAFMAPRILDPFPPGQLTVWGLRGLTTLDPRLTTELRQSTLRLVLADRLLLTRPAPAAEDPEGWGAVTAELARAAWDASEPVRHAGTTGVVRGFFDELFNHLDPYSRYTPPGEADDDEARRSGRGGAGLRVAARATGFFVQDTVPDGPAARAGVRPGDAILAIDGESTEDADLATVNAMLAGPEETQVTLTLRGRDRRARDVAITRALIVPNTVTARRVEDVLVLRVSGFNRDTALQLGQAITRSVSAPHPPRGVAIDLRGNPGGLLRQAVGAAQVILARGVVSVTAGRDPAAAHEFRADGTDLTGGRPVVVVVDGRSASAAEILAAALADQHRAVVVGSSTLGKGLVQTIASLPDGGELLITWSRVLAPLGWPLQGLGVLPQVCTSLGQDRLNQQLAELSKGHQPMARALTRHRAARADMPPAEMLEIRGACPAAEGRDTDLTAARFLIANPKAYDSALLGPPPESSRP